LGSGIVGPFILIAAALYDFAAAVVGHFGVQSLVIVDAEGEVCGGIAAPSRQRPHEVAAVIAAAGEDCNSLIAAVVDLEGDFRRLVRLGTEQGGEKLHDVDIAVPGAVENANAVVASHDLFIVRKGNVPFGDATAGEFEGGEVEESELCHLSVLSLGLGCSNSLQFCAESLVGETNNHARRITKLEV